MTRKMLIVSGKVQGVFYRDYVRTEAEKLKIKGYVRNLQDGTVEVVLDGSEYLVSKMILACRKGSFLASVDNVRVEEFYDNEKFEEFEIRF